MNDIRSALLSLCELLSAYRFTFSSEKDLQDGIEGVFEAQNVEFIREYKLSSQDRPDFLLSDGIVLEVKIGGSSAEVVRQVARYAEHSGVSGILLVTTRANHDLPGSFSGKPLVVHFLERSMF